MKSKIKKLEGTQRQLDIEMPKEKVDEVFNQVVEDIRKKAAVPGFRQGKAPLDIILKNYREDVVDEVKKILIPQGYERALEEHKIEPLSFPEIFDIDLALSGALVFKAKVDVFPEVNVKKYKGLKVTKEKVQVADEEVEKAVSRIRDMNAEFVSIERPLNKGDFGICSVETNIDGKPIGKKNENMWIEVNKDASLLGVGEELVGLKKGDKKDVEVALPESYPDKKYAGKKAIFHIEVNDTKEKKLPEMNDELAKKTGKETVEEMKKEIRAQLLERKESNARVSMLNQIMEEFLKTCSFAVPGSMVKRQLKVLTDRVQDDLAAKGVDKETIEKHQGELKEKLEKEAENKVRLYFILDKIATAENIEVTDEEIEAWLKALAVDYNQPFENVKKYYEEHNLMGGLKEELREEKTLDLLLNEAVVTEK
ncbi:MAG: trigger factor [Candidatus Omnitrophica bacterium]|nr:trigger factor [Candidatus Omnitrophota bacterium]